jgi:hypothetical protein
LIVSGALALGCSSKDEPTTVPAGPRAAAASPADVEAGAARPVTLANEGLNLDPASSPERLSGAYRSGETVLRFDSFRSGDAVRFKLSNKDGTPLVELGSSTESYTMSFGRADLTLIADAAVVRDAVAGRGAEGVGVPQQLEGTEIRRVGNEGAFLTALASPELALLPALSRSLADAGYAGFTSPPALTLHRFAMFRDQMADSETSDQALAETEALNAKLQTVPYCEDLRSNPNRNDCYGMCGRGCSCWSWVCGDCCYHPGCARHDDACRKCSWRNPVACHNCYNNIVMFVTVLASC